MSEISLEDDVCLFIFSAVGNTLARSCNPYPLFLF